MAKYLDSTGLQHVYSVFKTKFTALFAPKSHTHDDRYYTESEINSKLTEKVNSTDSRLSNARPASDVYSWAKASSKPSYSKSEVGLGNVANIDQSKAIKSITRSGTTFTATALDGTTSTFTQQDNNTTYGVVSTTANGLAPKRDGSTAHFLRGDGTWATPPNTTYTMATNAQIDALF